MKNNIKTIKKVLPYIFIFVFILIFFIQHNHFIKTDNSVPFSDSSRHLCKALEYFKLYQLESSSEIIPRDPFPPLTYLVCLVFFKLMGVGVEASQYCLFLYAVIFMVSLYGIGYEYGGHFSGAAVMALGASSPHVLNFSRYFFLDFPQTAITALAFLVLLKTRNYSSRLFSIVLGIIMALGFYTKWSILFFLAVPIIWFLLPNIIKSWKTALAVIFPILLLFFYYKRLFYFIMLNRDFTTGEIFFNYYPVNFLLPGILLIALLLLAQRYGKKNWKVEEVKAISNIFNFVIMCLIVVFLTTPWLLWSTRDLNDKFFHDREYIGFTMNKLITYMDVFQKTFSYAYILVFVGLIYIFILKFVKTKYKAGHMSFYSRILIPLNLIFLFVFMSFINQVDIRYILSFVIFAALLGGWWVGWTKKAKVPITAVIVIICIVSMSGWIFMPESSNKLIEVHQFANPHPSFKLFKYPLTGLYPDETNNKHDAILNEFYWAVGNSQITIYLIQNGILPPVEADYIQFLAGKRNLRYRLVNTENYRSDGENILATGKYYIISSNDARFINTAYEWIRLYHPGKGCFFKVFNFDKNNYKAVVVIVQDYIFRR